ncbi:hypothetical protein CEXT_584471 [Caerostris extrusa]|uniref:Secreted protein n=1 Tax=Caerostris extrusa TaxID=172846 RepID=A0AAV4U730_CAEEX|nr:hypothetical protein CEXT_584471 [Caerostris extrusa]
MFCGSFLCWTCSHHRTVSCDPNSVPSSSRAQTSSSFWRQSASVCSSVWRKWHFEANSLRRLSARRRGTFVCMTTSADVMRIRSCLQLFSVECAWVECPMEQATHSNSRNENSLD